MNLPPVVHIWSAAPTPLAPDLTVDVPSVERMVAAAIADGLHGLFVGGTCGEGPWLTDRERARLVQAAVRAAGGRLKIAAQVTDNSVPRIRENAEIAAAAGADYAIIAPPSLFLNATPARIADHFIAAVAACPIPAGVYDLGRHRAVVIPEDRLREVYLQPNVHLVKDSSGDPARRAQALAARAANPALRLFNGDEFRTLEYLEAGYDGLLLGGASATAPRLHRLVGLAREGRREEARRLDEETRQFLYGIYGGKDIACWLSGLKYFMVRRGLFTGMHSFLGYPLTDECRAFIERHAAPAASG